MAAITVHANDKVNTALQGEITNLSTLITAAQNAGNYPLAATLTALKVSKESQLTASLLGEGSISGNTILAGNAATYTAPAKYTSGPIK